MMNQSLSTELELREIRNSNLSYERRRRLDRALRFFRSCAVCKTMWPPIDLLCPRCWNELGRRMNRGAQLRQTDFVFPTYSLLTWSPANAHFVKPLIYAFKGGYGVQAAEKLAALFALERSDCDGYSSFVSSVLISAPSTRFDHSVLWSQALAQRFQIESWPALRDKEANHTHQKELRKTERGQRRHVLKEDFANPLADVVGAKRILFADDVITSGSTAMAAYMALGDPDQFEVWTLVARPRLAVK